MKFESCECGSFLFARIEKTRIVIIDNYFYRISQYSFHRIQLFVSALSPQQLLLVLALFLNVRDNTLRTVIPAKAEIS